MNSKCRVNYMVDVHLGQVPLLFLIFLVILVFYDHRDYEWVIISLWLKPAQQFKSFIKEQQGE